MKLEASNSTQTVLPSAVPIPLGFLHLISSSVSFWASGFGFEPFFLLRGLGMKGVMEHVVQGAQTKCSLPSLQLSRECRAEVQRILHQRAMDVKLDPALQDKCMIDLGKWCSEKTETGQVLYTEQPTAAPFAKLEGWEGHKREKCRNSVCGWLSLQSQEYIKNACSLKWNLSHTGAESCEEALH